MPIEWVVPAVALLVLIWGVITHRRLIALRDTAAQLWSDVDAQFRQRQELVSRLIRLVEGRLAPGAKPVRALIDARRVAANAQTPESIGKAEASLSGAVERVLAMGEAHDTLRADAGFLRLRSECSDMEDSIEAMRRAFNEAVEDYNAARLGFSGAFLAYVIRLPLLERLSVPKPAEPKPGRAVQRL